MEQNPESISSETTGIKVEYEDKLSPMMLFFKDLWKLRFRDITKQFFVFYVLSIVVSVVLLTIDMSAVNTVEEDSDPSEIHFGNSNQYFISSTTGIYGNNINITLAPNSSSFIQNFQNHLIQITGKNEIQSFENIQNIRDIFYESPNVGIGAVVNKQVSGENFDVSIVNKDALSMSNTAMMNIIAENYVNQSTTGPINIQFSSKYFAHPNMKASFGFEAVTCYYVILSFCYIALFSSNTIFKFNTNRVLFYLNINGLSDQKMFGTFVLCMILEHLPVAIIDSFVIYFISPSLKESNFFIVLISTLLSALGRVFFAYSSIACFLGTVAFSFHYLIIYLVPVIFMVLSMFRSSIPSIILTILSAFSPSQGYMSSFYVLTKCKEEIGPLTFSKMNIDFDGMTMTLAIILQIVNTLFMFLIMVLFMINNKKIYGQPILGWKNLFNGSKWKSIFRTRNKKKSVMNESSTAIKLKQVDKTYKGHIEVHALNKASCSINPNEIIVMVGPNGSGKSTLIDALIGTIDIDHGSIKFFGQNVNGNYRTVYDNLGIVFQNNVLIDELTVAEHFELIGSLHEFGKQKLENERDVLLNLLELSDSLDKQSHSLSGGQKRKLCIGLALLSNPQLMIFDEPTAGVDVASRQTIWKTLSMFKQTTSLITSHALEEAEQICSRLFVMVKGQISFMGTPAELRVETNCGYILSIVEGETTRDQLLEFAHELIPDTIPHPDKEKSIIMPADLRVADLLEKIEKSKESLNLVKYDIHIQNLEESLIKLIEDEEFEQMHK
ncbi:ABC transporter family protein [Tritrichomonas foetus]|uniref:ABC transporter family protein n=1 Tax=Tritrichomonas foetus TaxID=1144522 RepID=A0A1J4JNE5_9EUKA|nr:ABC transporter family protein [Tritrichomonas foetus]|eukprot:OHS99029.1 ABC transporter family protein [Tritrichomonas foetus]